MSTPWVWIDATQPAAGRRLWGMSLVERQVRELARRGLRHFRLLTESGTMAALDELRDDLHRLYEIELEEVVVEEQRALFALLAEERRQVLLLAGDIVYDDRALDRVLKDGPGTGVCGDGASAIFCLSAKQCEQLAALQVKSWSGLRAAASALQLRLTSVADLDPYIAALRLTMPAYMHRLGVDEDLCYIDHLMYRRTFKGAIDAVARYGYYHLVRWITRQLARGDWTPNFFTLLSVLCVWAASPLLATGNIGVGLLVAWAGVILDSVDGKLARLRLHLSDAMGTFEHLQAMPGLGLWFVAVGWHLSAGELLVLNPPAIATGVLLLAFLIDKATSGWFKAHMGREIFDYSRIDALFHLLAARRNIALLLLSVGGVLGHLVLSFYALACWMVFTLAFHLVRFAWVAIATRSCRAVDS